MITSQGRDWVAITVGALGISDPWEYWSHSLPAVAFGALAIGIVCWLCTHDGRVSALLGGVYLTHPLLDLVTGLKPTWRSGPLVGACLYDWPIGDFLGETVIVIAGLAFYRRTLQGRAASLVPALMLLVLVACQAGADAVQDYRREIQPGGEYSTTSFPGCGAPRRGRAGMEA